jgi:DNA-binding transcriptional LysR family regulator
LEENYFQMNINNALFDGMLVFSEVVDAGGFSAAARRLGHSASHVSKEIARLEDRLGARLLNRTTRTVSLTEDGKIYYEQIGQVIRDAQAAEDRIVSVKDKPVGLLRVSVPVSFSLSYLNAWLPEFLNIYPDIQLEIEASDRRVEIVAGGFDVVVRVGQLDSSDLIAKRLMMSRGVTVASPDYLRLHGEPSSPEELSAHTLIDFSHRRIASIWTFAGQDGREIKIRISPRVVCDSAETELALAVAGIGITQLPSLACQKELASGALQPILTQYEKPPIGVWAVYPSRSHLAAKVRVFVDFLDKKFSQ